MADALAAALLQRGLTLDHAASLDEAEAYMAAVDHAALLLDLGLPDGDGLAWLRRRRAAGETRPVLVLTARGSVEARVRGLHDGADDYIVKPFDADELHARLLAVLRRQGGYLGVSLTCARLTFDVETRMVRVGDEVLTLSTRETELLELLLRRAGNVVPKRVVEDQLFGAGSDQGSRNAVEVYVHRLRKRLDEAGTGARIETVRGVGYLLRSAA
ncbi:response regulator transcription factor [Sphingomonas endophytica]|uniref:Two-component system response regulator TctD n=1 Tax=Sphingomonas endophytica TaxID=869719 RepID=A0A7X0JB02_9SPHN|nr:two-component system response regulator TctD [Sphingomonas endophytica]MBB6504306.1 two-component system response regulator TctD [Sphingomonas endophytica]